MNIFDANPREPIYAAINALYQGYVPVHQADAEALLSWVEVEPPADLHADELAALERVAGRRCGTQAPRKGLKLPPQQKATPSQLARRANLSAGQERRQRVATVLKADPSTSNTQIAAALRVSRNTVAAVRRELGL